MSEYKKTENPFAKLFISGGVTIFFEALGGGHYFEMVKILKQTTNNSYATITKRMIANKGIVGILDGFVPWGALQASIKGSSFGFGEAAAKRLLERIAPDSVPKWQREILSGGMGGFVQGIVMSPMLLLKTRVMTDPRFRTAGGFIQTSIHSMKLGGELIRTEGGLMSLTKEPKKKKKKGHGRVFVKRFADWTTRYGFVVLVEHGMRKQLGLSEKQKLSKTQEMVSSLAGGTLSALATVPIDVTVSLIQQASKKGQKVSVFEIYREQFRSGGLRGTLQLATRGLVARVTHVALTVLMMKNVSSWCYSFLVDFTVKK
ncbi:hypothetical protein RFI_19726 [Reticulomyxa filosa]|uniref:Mitochondrial carrier protein n=1 Tax=Reticulomyxa filosa TaxID=46433 RepID=X6MVB8_RETFI|nr:hypothetical protein RFI_19726 [Reticulomyxa filosa]|eukprot:ETO17596.1 hypothetical protein RFI_19726 [Reticulomyxa filosa]